MQRALIVGGTLGLGTAIVFAAAAIAATLFPNGGTISAAWNGAVMEKGFAVPAQIAPAPAQVDIPDATIGPAPLP